MKSIERDLSRYENTNNIIYHLLRVECNTFANWIHLKIFSRASKNIFTKKPKKTWTEMHSFQFIFIFFIMMFEITYNMTRKMHDDDDSNIVFENDPEDVRL